MKIQNKMREQKKEETNENEVENFVHTHTHPATRFSQIEYNLKLKYKTYFVSKRLRSFFSCSVSLSLPLLFNSLVLVVVIVHSSE